VCKQGQSSTFSHYKKLDVSDGWFDVYQLPGNVYAFYEPRQDQQVLSYLIVGEKRALLFDSGLGISKLGDIVRRLTSLPVVLDRNQKQLFTGDTFYPDEIWLWWPETDLEAYQKSIQRIAALAPSLKILRPAHSAPEADPAMLAKVAQALPQARSGKMQYKLETGRRVYQFSGFSIALTDPAAKP
jgi:hypothetical protein